MNINIVSWNIEGLQKHIYSDNVLQFCYDSDIVSCCETWSSTKGEFDNLLQGYTHFDSVRIKRTRRGRNSGGISVFVKNYLLAQESVYRIFEGFENCVILLFDKSIFKTDQDVIMCFVYISPEGSPIYNTSEEKDGIKLFEKYLFSIRDLYPNEHLFLAGDFNARIKTFLDFIPEDNLNFVFGDVEYEDDPFGVPRNTKDGERYNNYGKSFVQLCCTFGIHVLNGRVDGDSLGEYTCTANAGASVVDYMAVSTALFSLVSSFSVLDRDESVHFPIRCIFKIITSATPDRSGDDSIASGTCQEHIRYIWKDGLRELFISNFNNLYQNTSREIVDRLAFDIDQAADLLLNMYYSAAECLKYNGNANSHPQKSTQPMWWDAECESCKFDKNKLLRHFRITDSLSDLKAFKSARNKFKHVCKVKKANFEESQRDQLVRVSNNPKQFWKLLKSHRNNLCNNIVSTNIHPSTWFNYFKELLHTEDIHDDVDDHDSDDPVAIHADIDFNEAVTVGDDGALDTHYMNAPISVQEV